MRKDQIIIRRAADPDLAALDTMVDRGKRILPDQLRSTVRVEFYEQSRGAPPVNSLP